MTSNASTDNWVRVCRVDELPVGRSKAFEIGKFFIALCRTEERIFAVDDLCPHDMGPLGDTRLDGNEIVCPRHGARFDVCTGKVLCLPALANIQTFLVRLRDEHVEVRL